MFYTWPIFITKTFSWLKCNSMDSIFFNRFWNETMHKTLGGIRERFSKRPNFSIFEKLNPSLAERWTPSLLHWRYLLAVGAPRSKWGWHLHPQPLYYDKWYIYMHTSYITCTSLWYFYAILCVYMCETYSMSPRCANEKELVFFFGNKRYKSRDLLGSLEKYMQMYTIHHTPITYSIRSEPHTYIIYM